MSKTALIRPEGNYWSARAPFYSGLFNTPESAAEHAVLAGAENVVVACYVCGGEPHEPTDLHTYWAADEAEREFTTMPQGTLPSMTAAETLDPREAIHA